MISFDRAVCEEVVAVGGMKRWGLLHKMEADTVGLFRGPKHSRTGDGDLGPGAKAARRFAKLSPVGVTRYRKDRLRGFPQSAL